MKSSTLKNLLSFFDENKYKEEYRALSDLIKNAEDADSSASRSTSLVEHYPLWNIYQGKRTLDVISEEDIEEQRKRARLFVINSWILSDSFISAVKRKVDSIQGSRFHGRRIVEDLIRSISNSSDNGEVISIDDEIFLGREFAHDDSYYTRNDFGMGLCNQENPWLQAECIEKKQSGDSGYFDDNLIFTIDHLSNQETTLGKADTKSGKPRITIYLNAFESIEKLNDLKYIYETIIHEYIHVVQFQFRKINIGSYRSVQEDRSVDLGRGTSTEPSSSGRLKRINQGTMDDFFVDEINKIINRDIINNFESFKREFVAKELHTRHDDINSEDFDAEVREWWDVLREKLDDDAHIHLELARLKMYLNNGLISGSRSYGDVCKTKGSKLWGSDFFYIIFVLKCTQEAQSVFEKELASNDTKKETGIFNGGIKYNV